MSRLNKKGYDFMNADIFADMGVDRKVKGENIHNLPGIVVDTTVNHVDNVIEMKNYRKPV